MWTHAYKLLLDCAWNPWIGWSESPLTKYKTPFGQWTSVKVVLFGSFTSEEINLPPQLPCSMTASPGSDDEKNHSSTYLDWELLVWCQYTANSRMHQSDGEAGPR
jgi:hypothetical protein